MTQPNETTMDGWKCPGCGQWVVGSIPGHHDCGASSITYTPSYVATFEPDRSWTNVVTLDNESRLLLRRIVQLLEKIDSLLDTP